MDDWYEKFLIASINKCINVLENGGYFVVNIVERMIEDVSKLLKFCGTIGYANKKNNIAHNPQGMFVFKC